MKNKVIILNGNIGSGKSTVANILSGITNIPIHAIDDYRIKYSDGTINGENYVWMRFLNETRNIPIFIFDSTGISKKVPEIAKNKEIFNLFIDTNEKMCLKRFILNERNIPYPYHYSTTEESISNMHVILHRNSNKYDYVIKNSKEGVSNILLPAEKLISDKIFSKFINKETYV